MKSIAVNQVLFSTKKVNRINRINNAVKNYLDKHPSINEIQAVELMPLFISLGIFTDDIHACKRLLMLLREINRTGQLHLFQSVLVVCQGLSRQWYFLRSD